MPKHPLELAVDPLITGTVSAVVASYTVSTFMSKRDKSKVWLGVLTLFYLIAWIVMAISLIFWREDRSVTGVSGQIDSSDLNETGILVIFSVVFVLIGSFILARCFTVSGFCRKKSVIIGAVLLFLGYLGVGFSASFDDRRFSSFNGERTAFTMPAVVLVLATFLMLKYYVSSTIVMPTYIGSWILLVIGNSWFSQK